MGIQLGEILGIPNVNAVIDFTAEGDTIKVTRELDEEIEHIEMQAPAVLSVLSDMAQPRTCKVADIMSAGRKPVHELTLEDIGLELPPANYEVVETKVPEPTPRKMVFFEATDEGIDEFIRASSYVSDDRGGVSAMKIFVIAEREQPVVELCAGARQFADEVDLIALPTTSVAPGVADTVYRLEVPEGRMMEDSYLALVDLIEKEKPAAVFAESSRRIQLLLGRVAARVGRKRDLERDRSSQCQGLNYDVFWWSGKSQVQRRR